MRTFWKKVACTPFLKATIVPPTEVFQENDVDLALWRNLTNTALWRGVCGKLHIRNRLNGFPDAGAETPD